MSSSLKTDTRSKTSGNSFATYHHLRLILRHLSFLRHLVSMKTDHFFSQTLFCFENNIRQSMPQNQFVFEVYSQWTRTKKRSHCDKRWSCHFMKSIGYLRIEESQPPVIASNDGQWIYLAPGIVWMHRLQPQGMQLRYVLSCQVF